MHLTAKINKNSVKVMSCGWITISIVVLCNTHFNNEQNRHHYNDNDNDNDNDNKNDIRYTKIFKKTITQVWILTHVSVTYDVVGWCCTIYLPDR